MVNAETKKARAAASPSRKKTLLLVAPTPPPIGGSPLTVQAMLSELADHPDIRVSLVNTSPTVKSGRKMTGFNVEKVKRTAAIVPLYLREIRDSDAVLVFANDLFAITLVPILLLLARTFRKPFYLKPVGAGLDLFVEARVLPLRAFLKGVLRFTDGILAQTQLLREELTRMGFKHAHYLPGCRPGLPSPAAKKKTSDEFRLIFLGHVTRRKGPLILIDALRTVARTCEKPVSCDFFGPLHDDIRDEFLDAVQTVSGIRYRGVAEPGTGPQLIAGYDALVLPTYYDTEGHPGVLIEAMHAAVPVISTRIRTLPELVTDGENGFLVPIQDSAALAAAIRRLALDPDLRAKMGEANARRGAEFRADVVVSQLLDIVFPDGQSAAE